MSNVILRNAKANKRDEFYTLYENIEKELRFYPDSFKDKIVYCNCDNPDKSNFYLYFKDNFSKLGIKKLISSYYDPSYNRDLFSPSRKEPALTYRIYDGSLEENRPLRGNGDFRSRECVSLLEESDIVVTNPPFSLYRELISLLVEKNKDFLLVSNINALTYKEIFKLIEEGKIRTGVNYGRNTSGFIVPEDYSFTKARVERNSLGRRIVVHNNACCWLTSLNPSLKEEIKLVESYTGNERKYPVYDNYDAINIDRIKDIPRDYEGVMGVPLTFLLMYNPKQFSIEGFRKGTDGKDLRIKGKDTYIRFLIRRKQPI